MHSSDSALLAVQDARVPASAVLGEVGKGGDRGRPTQRSDFTPLGRSACVYGCAVTSEPEHRILEEADR